MVEFSENECLRIIQKADPKSDLKFMSYTTERFGDHLGYLGEYYRLWITVHLNNEKIEKLQFFVKSLPIVDIRSRREMLIESGIFHKEMNVYRNLLQKFVELDLEHKDDGLWCPRIYLVREDLIVFSDLTLQDYEILPFSTFDFSQQHVEATLRSLANFHACSMIYEYKEKVCIGKQFGDILFETSIADIPWFTIGLEIIRHIAETDFNVENSDLFYEKIFSITEMQENSPFNVPKVLCHRDLWKNNLMFRKNPLHCVLIDFQTVRYLPLSVDVIMAIICTTRREHYERMLSYYFLYYYQHLDRKLRKFSINLKTLMNFQNFVKSCKYHKKVVVVYKTLVVTETQVSPELFDDFTKEDHVEYLEGDRYKFVKKFMDHSSGFKERMLESIQAVVDEFLN